MRFELDVTDSQAVGAVFASVAAENGQLDIVVNNAGVGQHLDRISDLPDEEWDRVLAATLTGTFYCGRAAAAIMERQESGAIVNISSINGQNPAALAGAYNVAKAGVISLTRTWPWNWRPMASVSTPSVRAGLHRLQPFGDAAAE
ncbi:MAG: hypothetical protein CM1200mP2_59480 [Planctomycetaceae bacterium]|nr:MAG: hypothetical protein CM1200mP2_59480 [Planctomycetaceae bacterium]